MDSTGFSAGSAAMAATSGISVVPGLAKQYSIPLEAAALMSSSAPFIRRSHCFRASDVRFISSKKNKDNYFLPKNSKYETNEIFLGKFLSIGMTTNAICGHARAAAGVELL
jgi:hypothetical protein